MTLPRDPDHPEIPYPFPPMRETPRPQGPVWVPMVEMPGTAVQDQLSARRTVLLSGLLDHDRSVALCAELMAFDGASADPVELVVNSGGGPLGAASAVLDVIDLMRAPLDTTCIGSAVGTAGVLVACGTGRRRMAAHATISLRCDHAEAFEGSATEIGRGVDTLRSTLTRMRDAVVARSGGSAEVVEAELERGALHDARAALDHGWVDAIADRRRST